MTDLDRATSDETVTDADRLTRLARFKATFTTVPADAYLLAYTEPDGSVNGVTYGDIAALVRMQLDNSERLDRITTWHARETGPAGTVGDYCTECAHRWPCPTRKMADGTWTDQDELQ